MPKKKKIQKKKNRKKVIRKKEPEAEKNKLREKIESFWILLNKKVAELSSSLNNWKTIPLILIVLILIFADGFLYLESNNKISAKSKNTTKSQGSKIPKDEPTSPEYTTFEQAPIIQEEISQWQTYFDPTYNFELKFPKEWEKPQTEKLIGQNFNYQYKISFRESFSRKESKGFEIFVYNPPEKVGFLDPKYSVNLVFKDPNNSDLSSCKEYNDASIGVESYPAKEVYILKNDPCFKEAYFFRLLKDNYIYDIVPVLENGYGYKGYDGEKEVKKSFSEFYYILSTLKFNPKPKIEPKKINSVVRKPAPKRILISCSHSKDKPQKSKQHKGKHVDEDCCPDPDEWPNPACAYSASGYKIMISKP